MWLTDNEKKKVIELIEAGRPLPAVYKDRLFSPDKETNDTSGRKEWCFGQDRNHRSFWV